MSVARVASRAQLGLSAPRVDVEVHLGSGLPQFSIVGLPAVAVKESRDRVRAALANSGFEWPAGRVTVNLSPADLPKDGCRYDLPIALGIVLASGQKSLPQAWLNETEFYGELGLAGELKPVRGALLVAAHASREGRRVVVPAANLAEARIAAAMHARGAASLLEVCGLPSSAPADPACAASFAAEPADTRSLDLADVRGQAAAKHALIVAAAGGHSLLLMGPPGVGKSMLAQRLPGLLPPLDAAEALDVASIASVSSLGFSTVQYGLRPFRAPHHTTSAAAIIGGGARGRPGEVSLAHRGVLFLDELPEFNRRVLESLREPMESGVVAISRASLQVEYPARFQLVAAMNPCPCGWLGEPSASCRCAPPEIARYRARISGPLLDRIDLRVAVQAPSSEELFDDATAAADRVTSREAAAQVRAVRILQHSQRGKLNADLSVVELREFCALDRQGKKLLAQARGKLGLTARGVHRVLRVARTLADLQSGGAPAPIVAPQLAAALQLRRDMA
jgi:magnesium chelatase family protein